MCCQIENIIFEMLFSISDNLLLVWRNIEWAEETNLESLPKNQHLIIFSDWIIHSRNLIMHVMILFFNFIHSNRFPQNFDIFSEFSTKPFVFLKEIAKKDVLEIAERVTYLMRQVGLWFLSSHYIFKYLL